MPVGAPQRVYLGAMADNDAGRGVKVLSVRSGGPADRAGLQAQDLIVGAAGRKIRLLSELSAILSRLNPGDRLALECRPWNSAAAGRGPLGRASGCGNDPASSAHRLRPASAQDERKPSRHHRAKRPSRRRRSRRRAGTGRATPQGPAFGVPDCAAASPEQPAGPDR